MAITKKDIDWVHKFACQFAKKKILTVILDAAHGEDVTGKRSPDGRHCEYLWSRLIISKLKPRLIELGYKVVETNTTSKEIGLSKRKNIANAVHGNPKVLLSIHNNAAGSGNQWLNATGFAFYTTKGQTPSDVFAEALVVEFEKMFQNERMRTDKVDGDSDYEENFTVLMGSTYYACLAEILFQDNKSDVEKLQNPEFQAQVVDAFINGIELFNTYLVNN